MCTHDPACPPADAIDWWAARNITEHPGQGWTLLCNGALVFDDHGALLPDGRVAAISDAPRTPLIPPGTPGGGADSSVEQMQDVFHELHADGRHALCAICGSQYWPPAGKVTSDLSRRLPQSPPLESGPIGPSFATR